VRLGFPWTHVRPHFTDDRLRDHRVDAINARQIHSGDALEFISEMVSAESGSIREGGIIKRKSSVN
jgi:hypothetical protein